MSVQCVCVCTVCVWCVSVQCVCVACVAYVFVIVETQWETVGMCGFWSFVCRCSVTVWRVWRVCGVSVACG